ncbi:hypothetical protein Btru_058466 [Bulinus truncatus]|nr:hypothetical protein Btru_058466 [Bulinus truncatus]
MDTDDNQDLILSRVYDAMGLCLDGFNVFLICLRFGDRYTEEESNVINILERAFGPEFFKVCMLAITHGDLFDSEDLKITFDEWVQQNTNSFKGLFEKCGNRVYLFHNKGGEEKHFIAVRQIVDQVKKFPGKYLTETFAKYVNERMKISVELKQPQLIASIQEKSSLLTAFIEKAVGKSDDISEADIVNIKIKADDLLKWIEEEDKKTRIMAKSKKDVDKINSIAGSRNKRTTLQKIFNKLKENQTSFLNTLVGIYSNRLSADLLGIQVASTQNIL